MSHPIIPASPVLRCDIRNSPTTIFIPTAHDLALNCIPGKLDVDHSDTSSSVLLWTALAHTGHQQALERCSSVEDEHLSRLPAIEIDPAESLQDVGVGVDVVDRDVVLGR